MLGQRGKLVRPEEAVDWESVSWVQQLCALRVAVILCHARRDPLLTGISLRCRSKNGSPRLVLAVPSAWAQQSPQSWHLLEEEAQIWARAPWQLVLETEG